MISKHLKPDLSEVEVADSQLLNVVKCTVSEGFLTLVSVADFEHVDTCLYYIA